MKNQTKISFPIRVAFGVDIPDENSEIVETLAGLGQLYANHDVQYARWEDGANGPDVYIHTHSRGIVCANTRAESEIDAYTTLGMRALGDPSVNWTAIRG